MIEKKHNYFYKITNLVNGKYYYGIRSCDKLPDNEYKGGGKALKRAIKKYGWDKFIKEVIVDYPTRKEVSEHERNVVTDELIKLPECYNMRTGGDNEYVFGEEFKNKLKGLQSGEKNGFYGKNHTEEVRNKISNLHKGKKLTEATKLKMSQSRIGSKMSVESKKKLSASKMGHSVSEETKEKLSKANSGTNSPWFGRKKTEEELERQRQSAKKRKCVIEGLEFISLKSAADHFGIDIRAVHKRINSKTDRFEDWKYVEEG